MKYIYFSLLIGKLERFIKNKCYIENILIKKILTGSNGDGMEWFTDAFCDRREKFKLQFMQAQTDGVM